MPEPIKAEKKYSFTITAKCVGDDGAEMFDSNVTYKNMSYDDVTLVEGALIQALDGLNQFAKNRPDKSHKK